MTVNRRRFNQQADLPYELRLLDYEAAMQDVYDFFFDVNGFLRQGPRAARRHSAPILSGVISDMLTASLASFTDARSESQAHGPC